MEAAPVRMTLQWKVPLWQSKALTGALQALMFATRGEPGCVGCTLMAEVGDGASFRYVENWESESDLRRQIRSDRFTKLAGLVEYATERPDIEFTLPTGTRGLDFASEVRREPARWSGSSGQAIITRRDDHEER